MARRITVAAIAPPQDNVTRLSGTKAVGFMKKRWHGLLDKVLPDNPDLIVLPECCDRFGAHTLEERLEYYRERGTALFDFFAGAARRSGTRILYSAVRDMPDHTRRNSSLLIGTDGTLEWSYDKNYPMQTETETQNILPGQPPAVFSSDLGRIGAMICFDLNFEPLLDIYRAQKPDLLLFSSMFHGGLLQNLWAFRCRSWLVAATPVECSIKNPLGMEVAHSTNYTQYITARINTDCALVHLDYHREKLDALKTKHGSGVTILDPGKLGSLLVTSETDGLSVRDLLNEFEIKTLDEYLAEAIAAGNSTDRSKKTCGQSI